ncbi:MAG: 2Fe-2S iron-sulfur cluster-binding protein [Opitutaceae bacterium]
MSETKQNDGLISVFVDGTEVRCAPGTNMIDAAAMAGREVPHYCYHPKLSVSGNCRMCLVQLGLPGRDRDTGKPMLDAEGNPVISWFPGPAIACGTKASPGMHIRTDTDMVRECREGVMEFLLLNHPLDCPICDQAGECRLQEFSTNYGTGYSRFLEEKNVKPKRTVLGPRVILDDERCILCSRCIRFSKEVAGDDVLGFVDRGSYTTLTCYPGKKLENNYSLNTVDICPVGALTSTDFRFKMRVWFLKATPQIDTESSVGCNTQVWAREGKIYRITPRRNDAVNDTWMPDSGRILYKSVEAEDRLTGCRVDGQSVAADVAVAEAGRLLAEGSVAVVGSGRSSVEEQFLLKQLADALQAAPAHLVSRVGEGDGILLSRDRNPNVRGALVTGLIDSLPDARLDTLGEAIDSGAVRTVLTVGEDLVAAGITEAQLKKVRVIALATHENPMVAAARVVLAGLTVFEKSGSFVNQQFRLQKFLRAVPAPAGPVDDLVILGTLLAQRTGERAASTVDGVWSALSRVVPQLSGITFEGIADTGNPLDGSAFDHLSFVEEETLHYKPASLATA